MSEEPTKDFSGRSFEEQVLIALSDIRGAIGTLDVRLTTLEDRVDSRLRETRPIWEAVHSQLERLDEKFDNVIRDLYEVRADVGLHDKRLKEIERLLNS